jgi:hypothetical protein
MIGRTGIDTLAATGLELAHGLADRAESGGPCTGNTSFRPSKARGQ